MALSLGRLAIIVGAGFIGSVIAKEGRLPSVPDAVSGAFKIAFRQLSKDDSATSKPKARDHSLLQQVNSLREELQLIASSRPITIVTSTSSGSSKYSIIVVVIVVGYGYVWWKGWKLSDMMFATRRSLSDACDSVSKKLENVYSAIAATKRHLSSRIDSVDGKIDECADNTEATRDEVSKLRGDLRLMGTDVQSVHHVVRSLETKITNLEGKQGETLFGVGKLVNFVRNLEAGRAFDPIEGVSRSSSVPALERPQGTPARALSLPPSSPMESSTSSTSNGSANVRVISNGIEVVELSRQSSSAISNDVGASEVGKNESSASGLFGLKSASGSAFNMVRRSCSAKLSFNF